jgi:tetratricopeptide (TPR) repeat protein
MRKFARRHKFGVAAGAAVAVAVLVGIAGTTGGMIWALRERRAAQAQAKRSDQVAHFLEDMLKGVAPSVALGRDTTMLQEIVDQTSERVDKDLRDQPSVQIELLQTLAQVYLDLALNKQAEETARKTLGLARLQLGEENLAVADSMNQLGRALFFLRKLDEAETVTRQAIAMQRSLRGGDSLEASAALLNLCDVLRVQSLSIDASLSDRTKPHEAETSIRDCLAIRRKRLGGVHNDVAWALDAQSLLLNAPDTVDEAEAASRESVNIRQKLYGDDHPYLASSYFFLGHVLVGKDNLPEAEACYRKAVSIEKKTQGRGWWRANFLVSLGSLLQMEGKLDEAEKCLRESVECARQAMGPDHPDLPSHIVVLSQLLAQNGKQAEARGLSEEAVTLFRRMPDRTMELSNALAELSDILLHSDDFSAAEPVARECLEIREKQLPNDWRTFNARSLLGNALLGEKKFAEAEPVLISGYEGLKQRETLIPAGGKENMQKAIQRLVQLYEANGQPDKGIPWKARLAEFDKHKSDL